MPQIPIGYRKNFNTLLRAAENGDLELNAFAFSPAEGRLALAMKLLRGVAAYISGRIADLSPASVKIETPTSVIGVRGTHILIGVDQP